MQEAVRQDTIAQQTLFETLSPRHQATINSLNHNNADRLLGQMKHMNEATQVLFIDTYQTVTNQNPALSFDNKLQETHQIMQHNTSNVIMD